MIGTLVAILARRGLSQRAAGIAAWIILAVAVLVLLGALWGGFRLWLSAERASAVVEEDARREVRASGLREKSAEERAVDALANQMAQDKREDAIATPIADEAAKPPAARATQPPQIRALNCALVREDYTPAELAKMRAYQENCR